MENIKERKISMNGIERLKKMIEGQKDKYLIKIVNYLVLQTEMDEAFLNEEKSLKQMSQYIKDNAMKEAIGGVAVIEDDVVYQWAKDYFNKSNKELGIKNINDKKEEKSKDKFGSIFDCLEENTIEDEKEEIEQISLF